MPAPGALDVHDDANRFWASLDARDQRGVLTLAVADRLLDPAHTPACSGAAFHDVCRQLTAGADLRAVMTAAGGHPALIAAFWSDGGATVPEPDGQLPGRWLRIRREAGEPAAALRARLQQLLADTARSRRGPRLDDRYEMWTRVDQAAGPGELLIVSLDSWLHVADTYGIEPSDAHLWTFLGRCIAAVWPAQPHCCAWAGHTFFAAYWEQPDTGTVQRTAEHLREALTAIAITFHGRDLGPLTTWTAVLRRDAAQSASDLFACAQQAVERRRASLPPRTVPAYGLDWEPRILPGPR